MWRVTMKKVKVMIKLKKLQHQMNLKDLKVLLQRKEKRGQQILMFGKVLLNYLEKHQMKSYIMCATNVVKDIKQEVLAVPKRILNFSEFPPPHTGVAIAEMISGLIKSWVIERKLFSITLDNASSNDVCVGLLKNQFRLMTSLVYDGKLFHLRCCAHILNLIVQDGLKQIDVDVEKFRECVKYVKGSSARKTRFCQCCSQNLLDTNKALMQDVPTRWNSTYRMLSCELYYRLTFSHLSLSDSNFQDCPSSDEWERIEKMCSFLKVFYDAAFQFSGSLYPASNLYFPQIFGIHFMLVEEMKSPDEYMKK
ncbi:unnamed protein product [Lactuca virosa]|uniref:hAT-like transposase RNase-H fold domain-containing protein n=1 Tax=Lactuca virosa TaxID=75947 RepID=A0AAU9N0G1_9ASTR|nr:unnamed protein product [Lactuca virosa]